MTPVFFQTRSFTRPERPLNFLPIGKEVMREIAMVKHPYHPSFKKENLGGGEENYGEENYGEEYYEEEHYEEEHYEEEHYEEEGGERMDSDQESDEMYDGMPDTTPQGVEGFWREVSVMDCDGEPTDDTEFVFELNQGKSHDEIMLEQAHRDALATIEAQSIEDLDFEEIARLKQDVSPVHAAEIDATIAKKQRVKAVFIGKDAGKIDIRVKGGLTATEVQERRNYREKVAEQVKIAELQRRKELSSRDETKPMKISPCSSVFRNGRWCNPCACKRGIRCSWAHNPVELRKANDNLLCCFDGGKGLCTKSRCSHRHTKLVGVVCKCGMRDLWVGSRRVFKGKDQPPEYVDVTAAILCKCRHRAETDIELLNRCGRPLRRDLIEALSSPEWISQSHSKHHQQQYRRRAVPMDTRSHYSKPVQPVRKPRDTDGWEQVPKRRRR